MTLVFFSRDKIGQNNLKYGGYFFSNILQAFLFILAYK